MHCSLTPEYLAALRFDDTQAATLRSLDEYRSKQQRCATHTLGALKILSRIAAGKATALSILLIGTVVARPRLKFFVIRNAASRGCSEQEIVGRSAPLALIHESAKQMPFNEGIMLQFHAPLYQHMPRASTGNPSMSWDMVQLVGYKMDQ